ncbi:HAMP domain-containing histidine kinase [bacterium]|nr:HAMP domain-containing histidine kinase [bacterium]
MANVNNSYQSDCIKKSAQDLEKQRDIFISTLTHDLKNPLQAQISSMELLNSGMFGKLNDEQKEMLDLTIESAKYMREMLCTILTTYKYENGLIKLEKENFDVDKLIKICIRENYALAGEKKIKFIYNCDLKSEDKTLYGDKKQLRRVIGNIINNGISYAFPNTEFRINLKNKSKRIIFEFENNSPMIDEKLECRLFEKYTSGSINGTNLNSGLGLYLSKRVVEAHNGRIYHTGSLNSNTFTFEIPQVTENIKDNKYITW